MGAKVMRLAQEFPRRAAAAAKAEFEIEKEESVRRTPKKTGDLRKSHEVTEPKITRSKIRVTITVSMPYAVDVHEDTEAFHAIGQAKFLESTLFESRKSMGSRIAARIRFTRDNWGAL